AWCAVGVGSCPSSSPTPTPTPTPGGGSELIVNGGFEGSLSPWVSSGSGAFYTSNGNYPHGGTGYIYLGVNNSVTGQVYQQVSIPSSASGTLTFWLNVTSSETTTTTAYDKLFVEVRSTSGALLATLATYSNLNKSTAGSYSQRSLNVSAYRGQTVRIQFRVSNDSSSPTTFRIDNVSLR
ncbi:MAG: choice-of-anchor J domain-containing protein, partial [Pyrinomonadaceae bacterium]